MGTLYWSIVALALGGCIGSFLNVVIYRGAVGLSIGKPARSFCPHCRKSIAWYDNIPVLSYLLLRARCRWCGAPISLQYPMVELATAFVFLMTYDAFFEGHLRWGIGAAPTDAIMLAAHWVLFAGLIVLTVMDLEVYMVDIRVTWLLALVGVVAHACWTPASSQSWIRPGVIQTTGVVATAAGLAFGAWWVLRRQPAPPPEAEPPAEEPALTETPADGAAPSWRWLWLLIPVGLVVTYLAIMLRSEGIIIPPPPPGLSDPDGLAERAWTTAVGGVSLRVLGGLLLLFLALTAAASQPQAEADAEIVAAIDTEAPDSRRMALWELKLLSPAIILCLLAMIAVTHHPIVHSSVQGLLNWRVWGDWRPVLGIATGLTGWILGGAIAWLARIVFTLAFGKEALGMGDVHIMAAAGAIAGWPVALLGFFLAALLGLTALPAIYLWRRQSRVLSYGPWLGLGFFLAAMFQDTILVYFGVR